VKYVQNAPGGTHLLLHSAATVVTHCRVANFLSSHSHTLVTELQLVAAVDNVTLLCNHFPSVFICDLLVAFFFKSRSI